MAPLDNSELDADDVKFLKHLRSAVGSRRLVPAEVVESLEDSGSALVQHTKTVLVFEDGEAAQQPIAFVEECPE